MMHGQKNIKPRLCVSKFNFYMWNGNVPYVLCL